MAASPTSPMPAESAISPPPQSRQPQHPTIASEKLLGTSKPMIWTNHPTISSEKLLGAPQPLLQCPSRPQLFPSIASERLLQQPKSMILRNSSSPHPHIASEILMSRSGSPPPVSQEPLPSPIRSKARAPNPGSPVYSQDGSPSRTTVPGSARTLHFDSAESSPAVKGAFFSFQTTFQSDADLGDSAEHASTTLPSPYQPSSTSPSPQWPSSPPPGSYQQHVPEPTDYLKQSMAATANMQHRNRIERFARSIHLGGCLEQSQDAYPAYLAGERGAADVSTEYPPSAALPKVQQFKTEEAFFSELRTQLYHTDNELDKYRGLLEHAMGSVLDAKTMLPPGSGQSPQAWQQGGNASRVSPQDLVVARGKVTSLVAPVLEQVDGMTGYGEALARRKKHMEGQLKASRAVLSASMEKEALKQAQVVEMDKDSWEGANNMLNSLVAILLPHLSQLEAIPPDRRTPSENTAVQVLSAAASC
eukprot:CAMPEP_0115211946 /NCGR_PEP_ID=MMETSP0270-20121206/23024_1 /TAXON_ID=71861 /ORGANISM="Scrippsiella trochoidea, Strain CCMP3099" /LENGTH=474 /DNA_ID=CAMNT_0002625647 /DNA_START=64 /DNA_END=1488 /DNA_ORIENTATION=+